MEDSIVVSCPRGDTLYIWRAGDTIESVARAFGVDDHAINTVKDGLAIDRIQPGDAVCITTRVPQNQPDDRPDSRPPSGGETCDTCPAFECPTGYRPGTVRLGDTFETILKRYDISYNAFRSANPALNINRLAPGQRFCAPPSGTGRLCRDGASSYIISVSGGIDAVAAQLSTTPSRLLADNPNLAPRDFIPGRVICAG